jgi:hypothetical protein
MRQDAKRTIAGGSPSSAAACTRQSSWLVNVALFFGPLGSGQIQSNVLSESGTMREWERAGAALSLVMRMILPAVHSAAPGFKQERLNPKSVHSGTHGVCEDEGLGCVVPWVYKSTAAVLF